MTEPIWLKKAVILALHDRLLAEFGGGTGTRDPERLEAAVARPVQRFHYGHTELHDLAASYAAAIIQGHPFIDGNKRTGFVCAVIFLELNGRIFSASEEDAVVQTLGLASSELTEQEYADWLRKNSSGD